jgi:hypothetical protein
VSRKDTAELLEILRQRVLGPEGQGSRAVFIDEVKGGTGWTSNRTIDAISVGMWPSRGCLIEGYELKTSRRDWQGELRNPEKAEAIAQYCDRFWLVTTADVAELGEVPAHWGWLVRETKHKRLTCRREATPLEPAAPAPEFIAAMLRRAVKADLNRELKARREEYEGEIRFKYQSQSERDRNEVARLERELEDYREVWSTFREKSGIVFGHWVKKSEVVPLVGEIVSALQPGRGRESLRGRISATLRDLGNVQQNLNKALEILPEDESQASPIFDDQG